MVLSSDGLSESTGSATPFLVSGRNADTSRRTRLDQTPVVAGRITATSEDRPRPHSRHSPTVPFRRNRR